MTASDRKDFLPRSIKRGFNVDAGKSSTSKMGGKGACFHGTSNDRNSPDLKKTFAC